MIIKYFAWIKNITNTEEEIVNNLEINHVKKLKKFLSKKYPKLKKHFQQKGMIQIAINLKYTRDNKTIKQKDEIAFFPPVSGG